MNYIFLDIDGVMNNRIDWMRKVKNGTEHRMFCNEAWQMLSDVVRETKAKVILSSSWRLGFVQTDDGIDIRDPDCILSNKLMEYFQQYNIPVVGRTTSYYDHRGKQITQYVEQYLTTDDKWVVLDDEACDMYGVPAAQIIKTEFETGLLKEHCERILKYFEIN